MNRNPLTLVALALLVLATLVSYSAAADHGSTLTITTNTTLTANVTGHIVIGADNIILDCAGYSVVGSGTEPWPGETNYGIFLSGRTGVTIKNCQVAQFAEGLFLEGSSGNTLIGNTARNNTIGFRLTFTVADGRFADFSSSNTLENNVAIDNGEGFNLRYASGNLLQNNTATNPGGNDFAFDAGTGFSVWYDGGNRLVNNTASGNSNGFDLQASSGNTVTENTAANNTRHGFLFGDNNIITDNTASGNAYIGFELSGSGSSNNVLTGNTAIDNGGFSLGAGFAIDFASNNTLERNTAIGNTLGFAFRAADNNTLLNNAVKNNVAGFQLVHMTYCSPCVVLPSTNNTIFHNNVINNTVQVDEIGDNSTAVNYWHHPILEEGNFWSDYTGADDGSGTGKHAIAGDGIGDTLIPHPGPDYDNFPFIDEISDTTPPVTTVVRSGTAGLNGWYVSPVTVTITADDDWDAPVQSFYRIDGGTAPAYSWTEYTSPFTLDEGVRLVEYYSVDGAGNVEAVRSFTDKIDTEMPATSLLLNGGMAEFGWYTSPQMVSFSASDTTSGVASTTYRIGTGLWYPYSTPFDMGDGVHTVEYYSTDVAGNEEVANTFDIEIDATSPSLSITSPVVGASLTTGDIEVTWTAADATSGIDRIEVSLDGAPWLCCPTTTTSSYTFTGVADGAHNVTVTVFDMAENSAVLSVEFTVDTSAPPEPPTPPTPSDSGLLLIGISVGVIAGAAAAVLLLIRRRRAE